MKKIIIFSDTHGYTDECIRIIEQAGKVDGIIHAGDCTSDAEDLSYIYPDIPLYYVAGNNDFFTRAPEHITVIIDGIKIYITHGHKQRVKYESSYNTLRNEAKKTGADLAVFGHTHIPYTSYDNGIILVNPGSTRFSHTYAEAKIENGKIHVAINEL